MAETLTRRVLLTAPVVPLLLSPAWAAGCSASIVINESQVATVLANDQIRILIANNTPGTPTDWVGIALAETPDDQIVTWSYLNGTQTAPVSGHQFANFTMIAPETQWIYEARLYFQDSFSILARTVFVVHTV